MIPLTLWALLGTAIQVIAADSYRIDPGQTLAVSEHGTARTMRNNGTVSVFIPTRTANEWNTFIANKPSYIVFVNCPAGYVSVPADGTNVTTAFCIMVYEAKNVGNVPTSQAASAPWTNINNTNARARCQSLGAGYDLPTLAQWQAMAQNLELVPANWSSGTVGTGCLRAGNLAVAYSGCSYNGPDPDSGASRNALASMTLSTGDVLWDVNGNVHEHIVPTTDPTGSAGVITTPVSTATGTPKTLWGPKGNYTSGCSGDPTGTCGMGYLHYRTTPNVVDMRGGAYDNEWGVFAMHSGYQNLVDPSVGFRCVYNP